MKTDFFKKLMVMFTALILGGCLTVKPAGMSPMSGHGDPEAHHLPAIEREKVKPQEGAIFNPQSAESLYQDSRARTVGDIILVKIVETSNGEKKASTKTSRESKLTASLAGLPGLTNFLGSKNDIITPGVDSQTGFKSEYTGDAETKRDSTVTATVSARVVDVTMDGNMIIRGFREITVNNEAQHIILSGIVRSSDVSEDNSILSSQIADARIEYSGIGVLSAKQSPGWLTGILDLVWPF